MHTHTYVHTYIYHSNERSAQPQEQFSVIIKLLLKVWLLITNFLLILRLLITPGQPVPNVLLLLLMISPTCGSLWLNIIKLLPNVWLHFTKLVFLLVVYLGQNDAL
jgi:hypothetical protein